MSNKYSVKLNRCNYYEREWITQDIKEKVAKKSNNRCSICGEHIRVGDEAFTIDHFIPLNKGGSNKIENLIPMCKTCNKKKADDIYVISKVPFLKDKHKKELSVLMDKYLKDYAWITENNVLSFDKGVIPLQIPVLIGSSGNRLKYKYFNLNMRIEKVKEASDEIVEFITNYNNYYNLGSDFIKDSVDGLIKDGLMYQVRKNSDNKLVNVFYFFKSDVYDKYNDIHTTVLSISNIICSVPSTKLIEAARAALLCLIIGDIIDGYKTLGVEVGDIGIEYYTHEDNFERYLKEVDRQLFNGKYNTKDFSSSLELNDNGFDLRLYSFANSLAKYNNYTEEEQREIRIKDSETITKQLNGKR